MRTCARHASPAWSPVWVVCRAVTRTIGQISGQLSEARPAYLTCAFAPTEGTEVSRHAPSCCCRWSSWILRPGDRVAVYVQPQPEVGPGPSSRRRRRRCPWSPPRCRYPPHRGAIVGRERAGVMVPEAWGSGGIRAVTRRLLPDDVSTESSIELVASGTGHAPSSSGTVQQNDLVSGRPGLGGRRAPRIRCRGRSVVPTQGGRRWRRGGEAWGRRP